MIIIGAKGFAKEVLQIFYQKNELDNLFFFDDVNSYEDKMLFNDFKIIQDFETVKVILKDNSDFVLGIGNPINRYKLATKFINIGGILCSTISPFANIGNYNNIIEQGVNIMAGTVITNDITIKEGVLLNLNCTIGHDCHIGKYVEVCPGVHISGNVTIGNFSFIGTGAVILPNTKIGENVIIGAGSVVTKNIPDNILAVGSPAIIKKELKPLILSI